MRCFVLEIGLVGGAGFDGCGGGGGGRHLLPFVFAGR